ncbi:IS200/IS605 family transposase [Methylacidiphilum caldifontis]|nr:IS200/IS605 family transposase [Methylacidiphilum caldifontis]
MNDDNNIRHGRHSVFKMHVHLVFVAKYRRRVFDGDAINRLRTIFAKACADFAAQLIEMDSKDDHMHLLVEYPPKVAVSSLVNSLKGVSSRLLRKERPDIQKRYWRGVLWSPSYFASSCGGAPISIVRQYTRAAADATLKTQGRLRPPRYPSPPQAARQAHAPGQCQSNSKEKSY